LDSIQVRVQGTTVGSLCRSAYTCSFSYLKSETPLPWISLTMPFRPQNWTWMIVLHPIFDMHLPEGFVLEGLRRHVQKRYGRADEYSLLKYFANATMGRLEYFCDECKEKRREAPRFELSELLAEKSAPRFEALAELYLSTTFVSGEQPKVLMPLLDKGSTGQYIVKAWGKDTPRQAENEYFCMSAARRAGIPVPEFHLSENAEFYITRRFDLPPTGEILGFEDLCVLQGKNRIDKYLGSHEENARTITEFVSPARRHASLAEYFKSVCLSVILRNGNAHLKNSGILYSADMEDRYLAPAYDIVTTLAYEPGEGMALPLGGQKRWPDKRRLIEFGTVHCMLGKSAAQRLYEECLAAAADTGAELEAYAMNRPEFRDLGNTMLSLWRAGLGGEAE